MYHCMIESTAYGARKIVDVFEENGIMIEEIVACGGIAFKNHLLLQIYADILGKPVVVSDSALTGCYGSAVMATVAAGRYQTLEDALDHLGKSNRTAYLPRIEYQVKYRELYRKYSALYDLMVKSQKDMLEGK